MAAKKPSCPVETYACQVLAGEVLAGRLVKLACQRHLDDLAGGKARGLVWDAEAARRILDFVPLLKHSKGEWAGQPVVLSAWQQFLLGCLFGWKRTDGRRRFRMAYCELARKNGKSTLAAGVGLYLAFFDGEPGAEVYTAATIRAQARIVHSEAIRMVKASPGLRARIKVFKDNLSSEASASKYEPLGKDADTLDGLNPSGVIVDELHAHKTRELLDVLETATGARRSPLIFCITTAGVAGEPTVCQEMHDYSVKVLEGTVQDDNHFAYVAAIDAGDDWQDEACWGKANPNLGVSCKIEDLRAKAAKAKEMPSAQATFRQKHCDEWVQSMEVWLPDDRWMRPPNSDPFDLAILAGRDCYGGLDLANSLDMCSFCLVFPFGETTTIEPAKPPRPEGQADDQAEAEPLVLAEYYYVLIFYWVPEDRAAERERSNRVNYRTWLEEELMTETQGDVTDYSVIRADINRLGSQYRIVKIGFDPFNARQLANELVEDGFDLVEFPQRISTFNEPMRAVEKLAREGRIRHGGHKVLRWNIGNVVARRNGLEQQMPDRKKSADKIDGAVALIMGLSQAMLAPGNMEPGIEFW